MTRLIKKKKKNVWEVNQTYSILCYDVEKLEQFLRVFVVIIIIIIIVIQTIILFTQYYDACSIETKFRCFIQHISYLVVGIFFYFSQHNNFNTRFVFLINATYTFSVCRSKAQ